MKYKGILLDIDNTLYDYNISHNFAKNKVLEYSMSVFDLSKDEVNIAYEKARKQIHIELCETAASHNRLLYFQRMSEIIGVNPMKYAFEIYNIYWDSFLEVMQPFDGVYEFLEKFEDKICLVTDLTAHIQYRKIKKLGLEKYCKAIVTSEEAGHEKPHPYMFMMALEKLALNSNEVCMIGDSFKKDVFGATNLDIAAIWFNHESKVESYNNKLITEVKSFKEILEFL